MPTPREPSVAGIVLAAGTSSRMGRNKMLLELDGESLLRRAVGNATLADLRPVLVVLGHQADRARRELDGLDCELVLNPAFAEGIGSSLKAGIKAVPPSCDAAVSILADMPHVTASMLSELVRRYREDRPPLVLSDYEGVTAPPFLYDRALFGEIDALPGHCDKRVVKRNRERAALLRWPAAALLDVDEPADLEAVRRSLAGDTTAAGLEVGR